MKIKTEIDVWQFDPDILAEAKPYMDLCSHMRLSISSSKCPKWLAELYPKITITQKPVWRLNNSFEDVHQVHLIIGNRYDFVIHPYDYIIQCKNKEIVVMKKKDFESLFGKSNF